MKKFLGIIALFISIATTAQKVKIKKTDVIVDDVAWLKIDETSSTMSLMNAAGDEIIFVKYKEFMGVTAVTSTNMNGSVGFWEISFLGQNKKIEIQHYKKEVLRLLYAGKVVNEDGTLNTEKVDRMVEKYGTPYSDQYNGGSDKTIIIKDESPKSGVNINIGR
ncbi:hypothetical protein [Flavobacterium silvaticum]|uniref:Uncharacterized protein n=1 Tax=Flavobacterium silvaticum TaxID=1852020 RepID=A0A972FTT7_9FLAO|nr:hypothetical protein [Flavobacterium silvaticum]NMH28358.1 hypothetical protein [Flavobacterium silvaticum]